MTIPPPYSDPLSPKVSNTNRHWFLSKIAAVPLELFYAVSRDADFYAVPRSLFSAPLFNRGERYYAFQTREDRDEFIQSWPDARLAEESEFKT